MKNTHCPICYEKFIVIDATPCVCCGSDKDKVSALRKDIEENYVHDSLNFSLYRAFEQVEIILCDLCTLEFTCFDPTFFGFSKNRKMWPENFQFLKAINKPELEIDKFCPDCNMRLAFINFTLKMRKANAT